MFLELGKRTPNSKWIKEKKGKDRVSKAWLKVKNVVDKNRWSHGCYRKVVLSMQKDSSQVFSGSLEISFSCGLILLKLNISWMKIWKTFLSYPKHFLSSRQAANFFLIYRIKSNISIFKSQKYSLLTITSDNGNNNEKTKCLKIWVGIFRVGVFQGGIFLIPLFHVFNYRTSIQIFLFYKLFCTNLAWIKNS